MKQTRGMVAVLISLVLCSCLSASLAQEVPKPVVEAVEAVGMTVGDMDRSIAFYSDAYLAATVTAAAVAKHHGVKAFINMSQLTLSQMSITETTASPQHKLHWLAEQPLNWSGLPVVHVRPTVLLEGFFLIFTSDSVRESNQSEPPRRPASTHRGDTVAGQEVRAAFRSLR